MERVLDYVERLAPDVQELLERLRREGVTVDAQTLELSGRHPDGARLRAALETIRSFPEPQAPSEGPVSVILCGGRGTRMRSHDRHKVCFPVHGRAAIDRALDAYEACGVARHVIVVGVLGEQVVREVTARHGGAEFAYQLHPLGTGSAAKQAATLLERQAYAGDVLVVAGDKVIDPRAVRSLYAAFKERDADLAVTVAPKRRWPDSGRIVLRRDGSLHSTVETRDIARARLLHRILHEPDADALTLIRETEPNEDKARLMCGTLLDHLASGSDVPVRTLIDPADTQFAITEADGSTTVLTADELEAQTAKVNVSVYLFKAPALYEALRQLRADNAQGEEYLTDAVAVLAAAGRKLITVDVDDPDWVLAYNNPEELLEIEDILRRREAPAPEPPRPRRTASEWLDIFDRAPPPLTRRLRAIYGDDEALHAERRQAWRDALLEFGRVYGLDRHVFLVRSPGRVNLMGRHVDHRGGYNNLMAIDKEVLMVVEERPDTTVTLHNMDFQRFPPRTFRIEDEVAALDWDDWLSAIHSESVQRMLREAAGDWVNYVKAPVLRLQERFRDRRLRGMNVMASGNIPMGAGLSSSSAIVVGVAEAMVEVNGLNVTARQFVDLCGEGEWYVGTRGGAGDHAAIKLSQRGSIARARFHPFDVEDAVPFPDGWRVVVCASGIEARKAAGARDTFNQRIAAYDAGLLLLQALHPDLEYLRDVNSATLDCSEADILRLVKTLPSQIGRAELLQRLQAQDTTALEQLFGSHAPPQEGYRVRDVCLFGIAECLRSRDCIEPLSRGDAAAFGRLMNVSHDGDRARPTLSDRDLDALTDRCERGELRLMDIPGGYGCSTPELDDMVDIALAVDGVVGAQLAGAGLGGCIMALARAESVEPLRNALIQRYYTPTNRQPQIAPCIPVQGSCLLNVNDG